MMGLLSRLLGTSANSTPYDAGPPLLARQAGRGRLTFTPVPTSWQARPTIAGGRRFAVRGESHYQPALLQHSGGKTASGCAVPCVMAQLVAEPTNPHDPSAIAVIIGADLVGYIGRDDTYAVHPVLAEARARGLPATCWASLTGGRVTYEGEALHIGVMLQMAYPPVLLDPRVPTLPPGDRVSVTGEEHCQEFLRAKLESSQNELIIAQLGGAPDGRVGIWIDGRQVGALTDAMSKKHYQHLRRIVEAGFPLDVHASLSRGAKKIEAYVYMPLSPLDAYSS